MYCPRCKNEDFKVTNTNAGLVTTRIRKCTNCGHSIHTVESVKYDNSTRAYAQELVKIKELKV